MTSPSPQSSRIWWTVVLVGALTAWVFWLRGPTIGQSVWNVDETIHTSVAQTLLDGGVLYRDAIDQRSPLTYYVFAAVFAVTGIDLGAIRFVVALMIIGTAVLLAALIRRVHDWPTALLGAVGFSVFANFLLYPGDAYAANTEWFVVLFTTAAAFTFWSGPTNTPAPGRCAATGVLLGLAALSKQSALLEVLPAFATLAVWAGLREIGGRAWLARTGALLGAFLGIILGSWVILAAAGAGDDYLFYAWTYNVRYYGPEIAFPDKLTSALPWFAQIAEHYPLIFASGIVTGLVLCGRAVQWLPSPAMRAARPAEIFLLAWCTSSLGGAMSGGRGFEHYLIPCMAPFAWIAARGVTATVEFIRNRTAPASLLARWLMTAGVAVFAGPAMWHARGARDVGPPPVDPVLPVVETLQAHAQPDDTLFVWGYNPDLHYYSGLKPASRYLYCTFQTGLLPWTNTGPGVDTRYAIVPQAMDTLLADLNASQPRVFVDVSFLEYRHFRKYPLDAFPELRKWVDAHYVELEDNRIRQLGMSVYLRTDAPPPTDSLPPLSAGAHVSLGNISTLTAGINRVKLSANSDATDLTGLALLADGVPIATVTLGASTGTQVTVPLDIPANGTQSVTLQALVRRGDNGPWEAAEPVQQTVNSLVATPEQAATFALPFISTRTPAGGVLALIDPHVEELPGSHDFAMHAPSRLRYELPPTATALRGSFSIPAGAYASSNDYPTDGAEFIVRITTSDGDSQELMRRQLNPFARPEDRGDQRFEVRLPLTNAVRELELEISPGPAGDASSDWTRWSNLILDSSP